MTENNQPAEVDPIDALGSDATPEEVDAALAKLNGGVVDEVDEVDDGQDPDVDEDDDPDADAEEGFRADGQPDWLPVKFKTPQDMAKSNAELERKLGEKGGKKKGPLSIKNAGEEEGEGEGGGPRALDQDHFNELGAEWYANDGKLTPETLDRLVKEHKTTPEFITSLMQNQADKNSAADEASMVEAGIKTGAEWNTIAQWAEKNLPANVGNALEAMLSDPSPVQRGAAITKLKSLYDKRRGAKAERLTGKGGRTNHLTPISSNSEFQKAMDDDRYFEDSPRGEKYRKEVDQRALEGGLAR